MIMNKKGVIKIIIVLIILVILFLFAAFYFIGRQKDVVEQQVIQESQTQNQLTEPVENTEQPSQEQTPVPIPTGGIVGDSGGNSGATATMPSGGGGGSGGGSTTPNEGNDSEGGGTEPPEDNITLPPECVYIRNAKLPQCVTD